MSCVIKIMSEHLKQGEVPMDSYDGIIPAYYVSTVTLNDSTDITVGKYQGSKSVIIPAFRLKGSKIDLPTKLSGIAAALAYQAEYYGTVNVLVSAYTYGLSSSNDRETCSIKLSMFYTPDDNHIIESKAILLHNGYDSPYVRGVGLANIPDKVDLNEYYPDMTIDYMKGILTMMQVMLT